MKSSFVLGTALLLTACGGLKNYPARGFSSNSTGPTETTAAQVGPAPNQGSQPYVQQQQQQPAQQQWAQQQQGGQQGGQQQGAQQQAMATKQPPLATAKPISPPIQTGAPATTIAPPPAGLIVTTDPENRFQLWVPEGTRRESKRSGDKLWVVFSKDADLTVNVKKLTKRELTEAMSSKESVGGTPEVLGDARIFTSASEGIVSFDLFRDTYAVECYGPTDARARLRQICTSFQPTKH